MRYVTFNKPAGSSRCHLPFSANLICALLLSGLCACGGSGEGLDENGRPLTELDAVTDTRATVDVGVVTDETDSSGAFNRIQNDILTPSCATSGCHSGTSAPLGLRLEQGHAYAHLVGEKSFQASGLQLVEPNNPDASYLMHKIEGTQSGGLQMPVGKPALSEEQTALVREWILEGAPEPVSDGNTNSASSGAIDAADIDNQILTVQPFLSSIQEEVFTPKCNSCHGDGFTASRLDLTSRYAYTQLVERASMQDSNGKLLVAIGQPDQSFLIDKIRGRDLPTSGSDGYRGERMPISGGYLDESVIQVIEQWIRDGANDN